MAARTRRPDVAGLVRRLGRQGEKGAIAVVGALVIALVAAVLIGSLAMVVLVMAMVSVDQAGAGPCRPPPAGGSAPTGPALVPAGAESGEFTEIAWLRDFLSRLGAPDTTENRRAVLAWMRAEGGHFANTARFNPLNTTMPAQGASDFNDAGVKSYPDFETGMAATLETIRLDAYSGIVAALVAGNDGQGVVDAVGDSPWGTGGTHLQAVYDGLGPGDVDDDAGGGGGGAGTDGPKRCTSGPGGPVSGEARELLDNPNVILDANSRADLEAGVVDTRIIGVLVWMARDHVIDVGPFKTGHSVCAGGSGNETSDGGCVSGTSNHYYGRAVDIGAVDGQAVRAGNGAAHAVVDAILATDGYFGLTELGQPWYDRTAGELYVFTEGHGDHIHLGIDA